MSRKILFIAYLFPPAGGKALPGVQRTIKFIRHLPSVKKYVLTLKPNLYPEFFSVDNAFQLPVNGEYTIRVGEFDVFKFLLKIRTFLFKGKKNRNETGDAGNLANPDEKKTNSPEGVIKGKPRAGVWARFKDFISDILTFPDYAHGWLFPAIVKGARLIRKNKIDVIFATGMPWTSLLVGAALKKMTGAKLIIDFRDPWATNPFTPEKGAIMKNIKVRCERMVVEAADCVTLNTPELTSEFRERYSHLPPEKFKTLYNGYDPEMLTIEDVVNTKAPSDKLILSHVGYLYGLRDPSAVLEALAEAGKKDPALMSHLVFQQIGYTNLDYDLKVRVDSLGLSENFVDLGALPYAEALQHMASSDLLVIIQPQTTTQIPSKIYEYIFYNKPIIAIGSKESALANFIKNFGFGDIFLESEVYELAQYLLLKGKEKEQTGQLISSYDNRELFDIKNISKKLMNIIDEVCR